MDRNQLIAATLAAAAFATPAVAAVSADEAKQLGTTLTAFGAEKAGNKEGTIPAYTGEQVKPPSEYDPKEPLRLPSPWKEKPLFTVTAQTMDRYADKLTVGQKNLFKKYPDYRMDIYPTHRTAVYPKYIIDNTQKNAVSCKAIQNGLVLEGCYGGVVFPIPKTGNEVMWNHVARFTYHSWQVKGASWIVTSNGPLLQNRTDFYEMSDLFNPARTSPATANTHYWKIRFDHNEPSRKVGEKYVGLYALDPINVGIRIWQYIPGQRRVKLAPDLAYDTPNPIQAGTATMDQGQVFIGAQDRYDFKLIGKQEKYIMYNNYELTDYKTCPDEKVLTKRFMNPDCVRWELHRVWVVEATLKPGFRHVLPKRTFYFDEDYAGAGSSDDYDAAGQLYRVTINQFFQAYNRNGYGNVSDATYDYDLQTGLWSTSLLMGTKGSGIWEVAPRSDTFFSPDALAGEGIR